MEGNRLAADEFAAVVRQLYRMFKTGTIHLMNNEAVTQSIGRSVTVVNRLADDGLDEVSLLFLNDTVFVNGTLLKAGREIYEAALDLGGLLRRAGANEMSVSTTTTVEELTEVVAYASQKMRSDIRDEQAPEPLPRFSEGASLRMIDPELLEDVQSGSMTARDRLGRTYASTLVVMRFLYDGLKEGRYAVSRQLKRLTQQLVLLADEDPKAFLGITRMRNVQDDEAGRAVNSAILAILATRELTTDVRTVSRVALSALMADIGRPRAAGMGKDETSSIAVIPMLNDEQRRSLPRDTVVAVAAVGRLHEESLHRTVVGYEAQWLANKRVLGELYEGEYLPCLESTLVYMVRRFNELITYDVYSQSRMAPDDAMRVLRRTATDETERRCADLLFQALGLVPRGTVVELNSGHVGVVVENSDKPGLYGLPSIQVFADKMGKRVHGILVDLAKPSRDVLLYGGIRRIREDLESPSDLPQVEHAAPPKARLVSKPSARKRVLPDSIQRRVANDSYLDLDDDIVVEVTDDFAAARVELSEDIEVAPLEYMDVARRDILSASDSGSVSAVPLGTGDFEQVPPPLPLGQEPKATASFSVSGLEAASASGLRPMVNVEPRDVTPAGIPSPHLAPPADRPDIVRETGGRSSSSTPVASPAVTTGALPVVADFRRAIAAGVVETDAVEADAIAANALDADTEEADAIQVDAEEADAEEADAEEADAGEADAGEADAGEADAGEADAGEADAGEADAGEA
ncbi:MAG: HD-GYP domain-containing protein (c-di-GMP phosphodiesterase class II), partial [Bradymonadia bacterium]